MLLLFALGCPNPWEEEKTFDDVDTDAVDTADTSDTSEDTSPPDTGPHGLAASDAVGTCLEETELDGASALSVTTLWEGDLPGDAWDRVPATSVISDSAAWEAFQADNGLSLGTVDFSTARVVVLTDWRTATCELAVESVAAWAMPDGATTYVEGRMRSDGSAPCSAVCEAEGSRMVVVSVPSSGGVAACRRTETWCP